MSSNTRIVAVIRRRCNNWRRAMIVALLTLPTVPVWAQIETVRFQHLTINSGLSQSSANAMLEDHRGFLWIGTQDGLNRFDGYEFDVLRHVAGDPTSLSASNISSLYEDSEHDIWVGTTNGTLHRYVRNSDSFERFRLPAAPAEQAASEYFEDIRHILETEDGRLWIGTRSRGLLELDRASGQFREISAVGQLKVNKIIEGAHGELWLGTDQKGLIWFFPDTGTVIEAAGLQPGEEVYAIVRTATGETWVAGSSGYVTRYQSDRTVISRFSARLDQGVQNFAARAMLEDEEGRIWIGFIGGGLQAFSPAGKRLAAFSHAVSDPYSLSTDTVYSLLQDSAGVLWVGSLAGGVSKASLSGGRFTNYWHRPEDTSSLSHNMVIEFVEDAQGGIWIGTSGGGLNYFDPQAGVFSNYRSDPGDPTTLSSDRVWGLHLGDDGEIWIGTWGGGLNRMDIATGIVDRYLPGPGDPGALPGEIVTSIVGDGSGGIWVGMADGGLVRKLTGQQTFQRLYLFDKSFEEVRPVNITAMFLDTSSRLWVGTWTQGLCMLPSPGVRFQCHSYDPTNPNSISDNNIRAINEDDSGSIWIATGNGISRFDERTESFDRYTSADGLVEGVVYGIVPQDETVLWLSSNQGLMRFDTRDGDIRNYDYADGLQANEFNGESYLRSSDGTYYFGGIGGITSFRPEDLSNNVVPPKVVITEFSLFNEPVSVDPLNDDAILLAPISETNELTLNFDQNIFGMEFAGLHFVSPELNTYAHMLVGFDRDWVYSDATRRFASYTNLDPGEYSFHVRAANSDGRWSERDAVVNITILPPWWMTWWARLIVVFAAIFAILLFVRWRLSRLQAQTLLLESEVKDRTKEILQQKETIELQAGHLEEVLAAKNKFFARLSHEFRTPITLMLGPIEEQLAKTAPEKAHHGLSMARRNGRRLIHLVDQLLGLAKHSGEQSIARTPIAIAPIARMVTDGFESAARHQRLTLSLRAKQDVWIDSNSEALQTILINLVSNSVKYTPPGGRVDVIVERENTTAVIRVEDTGVGIPEEELKNVFNLFERGTATGAGTGIGLTLVKELVDEHEGTIVLDSTTGNGTVVEIRLVAVAGGDRITDDYRDFARPDVELFLAAEHAAATADSNAREAQPELPQVLIIEDNDDMRAYVIDLLAPDYHCSEAINGREGLAKANELIPDLIITDVMMPEVDGFEVLHKLRDSDHTSHIPVVMLTALDDQASRLRGLEERADDYITKPFNKNELILKVRNLLELCHVRAQRVGQQLYLRELADKTDVAANDGLSERDRNFLARFDKLIEENYQNPDLRFEALAVEMFMSQRQLQRKLKAILDTVPASYLRNYRLKKARELLLSGKAVTDVAFDTGFSSPSYFGKCFKARFSVLPSEVRPP